MLHICSPFLPNPIPEPKIKCIYLAESAHIPSKNAHQQQQETALWSICENLQHEVNCLKRGHKDDGDKADDEDEPTDKGMRQKKKKKLTKGKIRTDLLNRPLQELSAAEKTTCEELNVLIPRFLMSRGLPWTQLRLMIVMGVTVEKICERIIDRTANIVWNEQNFTYMGFGKDRDAETCTLRHKDISFTKKDIVAFAKDKFWNLKHKYAEVSETEGGEQEEEALFARIEWTYPTLLLETEYMSEELSELETDNEEEKKAHHKILLQKAGFVSGLHLLVL
ncbi:hypothetical protein F4604DRAFT_1677810 [Suillus subluteus]|nr:hypothetical protein F4604DRAFT_1677810 [Suillus subluteus]